MSSKEKKENPPLQPSSREGEEDREEEALFWEAMEGVRPLDSKKRIPWRRGSLLLPTSGPTSSASESPEPSSPPEEIGPLSPLFFARPNAPSRLVRKLKRGNLPLCGTLDLHGLTWKEARQELEQFLDSLSSPPPHCVLVIHGKSHGAVTGTATLKARVYHYLQRHPRLLALASAQPKDGGLGAVYALLL